MLLASSEQACQLAVRLIALVRRLPDRPTLAQGLGLLALTAPISITAANVALVASLVLFARDWIAGRRRPEKTPLDGVILVWVAANLLSGVTSIDPLRSFRDLRNLGHWAVYYLFVWGVGRGDRVSTFLQLWIGAGVVAALQAILQATFGFDVRGRELTTPRGFFSGHLAFGHVTAVLAAAAAARWCEERTPPGRAAWAAITIVLASGLAVSTGRGPWLALLACLLTLAVLRGELRALVVFGLVVAAHAAIVAGGPNGLAGYYSSFLTLDPHSAVVGEGDVYSNLWRLTMWRHGLAWFMSRPISGTGVETTGELSRDFVTPFEDFGVAHLHSNYFELLMTRGYLGLAAFLLLLLAGSRVLLDAYGSAGPPVHRTAIFAGVAALVAHAVHGLTHFTLGSAPVQMVSYVALGLGVGALRSGPFSNRGLRLPKASELAWAIATLALLFAIEPAAASLPSGSIVIGAIAGVDACLRFLRGRLDVVSGALALAFLLGVVGSLLVASPQDLDLAIRVVAAAAFPFAGAYASVRLWRLVAARKSGW